MYFQLHLSLFYDLNINYTFNYILYMKMNSISLLGVIIIYIHK